MTRPLVSLDHPEALRLPGLGAWVSRRTGRIETIPTSADTTAAEDTTAVHSAMNSEADDV